jgi:hypothetical protein
MAGYTPARGLALCPALDNMNQILRIALVMLALSAVSACDDSASVSTHDSESGDLHGQVYSMTDSSVIAGASVSLIDAIPYRVIAGPVSTDDTGHYVFTDAPPGDWYLFVNSGNHFMFNPASARVSIVPGRPVQRDIRMIRSDLWDDDAKFAGVVTDARTGAPIAGAFVSSMMVEMGNSFLGVPVQEAITDTEGRYQIGASSWIIGVDLALGVVNPIGATKEGYAPFFLLDADLPNTSADTTYIMNVALHPSVSRGVIKGRVRYRTTYLGGIAVGLDYSTLPVPAGEQPKTNDARTTSLLGSAVRTDSQGRFEISDLAPGTYFVDVAFLPDDGFMLSEVERDRVVVELEIDERIDLGTLQIVKTLVPVYPLNGASIGERTLTLRWTSAPGADRYRLSAGTGQVTCSTSKR